MPNPPEFDLMRCKSCGLLFLPTGCRSRYCAPCGAFARSKKGKTARERLAAGGQSLEEVQPGPGAKRATEYENPRLRLLTRLTEMGWGNKAYIRIPLDVIIAAAEQVGCPREAM